LGACGGFCLHKMLFLRSRPVLQHDRVLDVTEKFNQMKFQMRLTVKKKEKGREERLHEGQPHTRWTQKGIKMRPCTRIPEFLCKTTYFSMHFNISHFYTNATP
jgi:hypothetical protein